MKYQIELSGKKLKKNLTTFFPMAIMLVLVVAGCSSGMIVQINTPVPNGQAGTSISNGQLSAPGLNIQIFAPGPNPTVNSADTQGRIAGILPGIWHGFISPVTLAMSFFNKDVQMYDVHNDGNMYNLGFFLGIAIIFIILGILFGSRR